MALPSQPASLRNQTRERVRTRYTLRSLNAAHVT
jgi:hypothetical protein